MPPSTTLGISDIMHFHLTFDIVGFIYLMNIVTNSVKGQSQGFVRVPISLNIVEGETAVFRCQHENAKAIGWRINQSNRLPPNTSGHTEAAPGGGVIHVLTVLGRREYNRTEIRCVAITSQGEQVSPVAYMFVQGILQGVPEMTVVFEKMSTLIISWEQPYSLNLSNVEPDISYCVDIRMFNDTSRFGFIFSTCGIMCSLLLLMRGAGNGTVVSTISDFYLQQVKSVENIQVLSIYTLGDEVNVTFAAIPPIYFCYCQLQMKLIMSQNTSSEHIYDCNDSLVCGNGTITLFTDSSHLLLNHLYETKFTFHQKAMVHRDITLSTFDIQQASVTSETSLSIHFMNGLSAVGGFWVIFPLTTVDAKCKMPIFSILPKCQLPTNASSSKICSYSLTKVPFGVYDIYFHDIEEDGLLTSPISLPATSIKKAVLGVYSSDTNPGHCYSKVIDGVQGVDVRTDREANTLSVSCSSQCMIVLQSVENPHILRVNFSSPHLGVSKTKIEKNGTTFLNIFILEQDGLLNASLAYSNMLFINGDSTANHSLQSSEQIIGLVIGIIFSISIIAILGGVVMFMIKSKCIIRLQKATENVKIKMKSNANHQSIEMKSCEAYETVNIKRCGSYV